MDLNSLRNLGPTGFTLSIEERAALQIAMLAIQRKENLDRLQFWGKITGESNDYLIAYAIEPTYSFPIKKFYYCTASNGYSLVQMPSLTQEWEDLAQTWRMLPFRGDPSFCPGVQDSTEDVEPQLDDDGNPIEVPNKEVFSEHHRLTYTVRTIDADVSVLPRGAFVVDAAHSVRKNKSFEGLSYDAAASLSNYYHFREPKSICANANLNKPGIVRPSEFLDPISDDEPKGVWSLCRDASHTMVLLRSFYWPGYFFYHCVETSEYGGVYFGDGIANDDIAFMLP